MSEITMDAMNHLRHLVETIGARGSTTQKEKEAAQYADRVLRQAGMAPTTETFTSARSSYTPFALYAMLLLIAELLYWLNWNWGAVIAAGLGGLSLFSAILELAFRPNPFRWLLPKGKSQNVWVRLQHEDEVKEQVVLTGHLDTHRTPLIFSSDGWVKFLSLLIPLGLVSGVTLVILFAMGTASSAGVLRLISLPLTLIVAMLLILTIQADLTPYTVGANDNASGASVALSMAERLKRAPLKHTVVWVVLTGCEEVGCYGADAFAQAHKNELGRPVWITIDNVGGKGAGVAYLTSETFLRTTPSDPGLLQIADRIAEEHPELDAFPFRFKGAYTEGAIGGKHGFRVLTLLSFRRDGTLPEWHRPTDVIDNLDPKVVAKSQTFLWRLLQEIDQQAEDRA
ncbi:MAG: M28 family metallopeptidase [bacterium]